MVVSSNFGVDKTSFGWGHSTHKLITEKLVKKHNSLLPASEKFNYAVLKYSCVDPDFSRKNITKYIHGHFADIDKPSKEPPDAFQLTIEYTNRAIKAHKKADYGKRDDYVGYALHFLQDMLNPMHIEFKPLSKSHPERIFHKKFEKVATEIQESVLKVTTIDEIGDSGSFFEELLPKAMRKSKKQLERIKNEEYVNIGEIVVLALDNTYKTTNLYFKKLVKEFTK